MNNLDFFIQKTGISLFYFKLIFGFVFSFLIVYVSIPTIIRISRRKNLLDEPDTRSSHKRKIPNLGGVAIFFALGVCAPIFTYELFDRYKFLFASLVILFFVGIMDDIMVLRAYKKLSAQILVSTLIVIGSDVRITSLFGILGIYELNYYVSVLFSIFTFIILINAFNLIDGIDGLAGSYVITSSIFFGLSFFHLGPYNYPLVVLCTVIIAATLGFLVYNLSEKRSIKIFMGDTGSMILGFLLAFTGILFIDLFIGIHGNIYYQLQSAPAIAIAILILPIIDTLTVIITRIYYKKSIMSADKNHIHHKLLNLGLSHRQSTACIIIYYVLIVIVTYLLRHMNVNYLLIIIMLMGFAGAYLPILLLKIRKN